MSSSCINPPTLSALVETKMTSFSAGSSVPTVFSPLRQNQLLPGLFLSPKSFNLIYYVIKKVDAAKNEVADLTTLLETRDKEHQEQVEHLSGFG